MQKILSTDDYINGILQKDRIILSKAITLIESTRKEDEAIANVVLEACLKSKKKSHRIAISGAPGAGKSTFINAFGSLLLDNNYSLAVLAVDPSSSISKGSILGDKTRMEDLVRYENCFIRPTAAATTLAVLHAAHAKPLYCVKHLDSIIFLWKPLASDNQRRW
jgi:LAO/AO transport system kinase